MEDTKYYEVLFSKYKTKSDVLTEIINLESILNLPKGTEYYISDIHGESEAFKHILRNGAGNVKEKIYELFTDRLSEKEINQMSLLIYYPEKGIKVLTDSLSKKQLEEWYQKNIVYLVELVKYCSSKYSRSKLRKALPKNFVYIIEELIYNNSTGGQKSNYYSAIINKLIDLGQAQAIIIGLSQTIQRLVVDHLHVVGDIFDRGAGADKVMDTLMDYHSLDIQWGNHDILWLGAYSGSKACLITLLRIAARYNYLFEVEEAYGLNLRSLFLFADYHYGENSRFRPTKRETGENYSYESLEKLEKVHQALTIIQFKLEGQIIKRRPDFEMDDHLLLDKINNDRVCIEGVWHKIEGSCFQTVDFKDPYKLTSDEEQVIDTILHSFQNSEKMQRHMNLLLKKGSMYLVYNDHLLFHGCIPLNEEGDFLPLNINNKLYSGKALLDKLEYHIRQSAKNIDITDDFHTDLVWYTWSGKKSPLYGRDKMTTFERYFIADEKTYVEGQNSYYLLREKELFCNKILKEFGLTGKHSRIINGHTPIKVRKGESPVKANGKLIVIDGGLSKSYHDSTGIGGYSLLNNSYVFQIVTHQPFISVDYLFEVMEDNVSVKRVIDDKSNRTFIKDTTIGEKLKEQTKDLEQLLKYLD